MILVATNNPQVRAYLAAENIQGIHYRLLMIDGHVEEVLQVVRDLCHKNHRLLTHPLSGSVKPNHTPFKTVVLEAIPSGKIDFSSVIMAENSLSRARAMLAERPRPDAAFQFLDDFALIDLDFFLSFMGGLNNLSRGEKNGKL